VGAQAEKRGFGADGEWLLSRGPAPGPQTGGSNTGWALLAGSAAGFSLAWGCILADRSAAKRGGCPATGPGGLPAPPGAERKDCCPQWLTAALILAGVILAIFGLAKLWAAFLGMPRPGPMRILCAQKIPAGRTADFRAAIFHRQRGNPRQTPKAHAPI
jgi:hypothetical protein